MQEIEYKIRDPRGMHARPAGQLVKLLKNFESQVHIGAPHGMVDGKHLLSVLRLALQQGDILILRFEGIDEAHAAEAAMRFLQDNL